MELVMLVLPASPGSCDLIIYVREDKNPKQDITIRCFIILTKYYHPDAGSDRGQEEKGTTEDEMAGWHH